MKCPKQADFLDITMDLKSGKYWPYRKPMSDLRYINLQSNHPPSVIKHIPVSIANRISTLSCNPQEFSKAIPAYRTALEMSGHKPNMTPPPQLLQEETGDSGDATSYGSTLHTTKTSPPMSAKNSCN